MFEYACIAYGLVAVATVAMIIRGEVRKARAFRRAMGQ